jgi:MurNAc alpha-1-phosphate uridylyltransferase
MKSLSITRTWASRLKKPYVTAASSAHTFNIQRKHKHWKPQAASPTRCPCCDIFCDYDFARLAPQAASLQSNGDAAHLVLVDNPVHHPKGDFPLHNGRIANHNNLQFTFSGIGIYRPELFGNIPRGSKAPLAPLLREQIALGKVSGEHHRGVWVDVGTPQRLKELDQQLHSSSS